jgi:hypothetical protein
VNYKIYRSTEPYFLPDDEVNLIASGAATSFSETAGADHWFYMVIAEK